MQDRLGNIIILTNVVPLNGLLEVGIVSDLLLEFFDLPCHGVQQPLSKERQALQLKMIPSKKIMGLRSRGRIWRRMRLQSQRNKNKFYSLPVQGLASDTLDPPLPGPKYKETPI